MPESRSRGMDWTDPPPPIAPSPHAEDDRPARPPIPPAPVQAPRRAPVEPGYRPPIPSRPTQAEDVPPDPRRGDPASRRRRPVIRPARPQRSEPRLDWPR